MLLSYSDGVYELKAYEFKSESFNADLPPVIFNSGFTGGVSMYGQLFGNALAALGYSVTTYDVSGFFTNKSVRNTFQSSGKTITNVSLDDQKVELLALINHARKSTGKMPVVISWAMGSVASLAAVNEMVAVGAENLALFVPMSYSKLGHLQGLRANADAAYTAIMELSDNAAIPTFDTGTNETVLGYYPLDTNTQKYVNEQLGDYTDAGGVDHWPGCHSITAKSYKSYVCFDPESEIGSKGVDYPPALIIHGKLNTLHDPAESKRLFEVYPGIKGNEPLMLDSMEHGQQLVHDHPVFQNIITKINERIHALN
jgi:pimeloyl-ACP methyl ester carboxylesterase